MRIFFISSVVLDGKDAQTTHTIEVFRNLGKICDTRLFSIRSGSDKKTDDIVYVPGIIPDLNPRLFQINLLLYQVPLFFYLAYHSLKKSPDILYLRYSHLGLAPFAISALFRIPVVIEINGLSGEEITAEKGSWLGRQVANVSERLFYRRADRIVAVTENIKKFIEKTYRIPSDRIAVISNGANTDVFRPMDKSESKERIGLEKDAKYICWFGRLCQWQGVEYLIDLAPAVIESFPRVKFLILGEGDMKQELIERVEKRRLSNNFIFAGKVKYEDIPQYVNASDICVIPKKPLSSGYSPLKLYESMACGKPVIASRLPGFEILEESNSGILIKPENTDEFSNAIIKLLGDEGLREVMGRNGREFVVKRHRWKAVAEKVADICRDTINRQQ